MPVIDASVVVEYLGRGAYEHEAKPVIDAGDLIAPHLIDAEVGHALRGLVASRELPAAAAEQALGDFTGIALARAPDTLLLFSAWELRGNFTFYDALYAALARELDTELVTFDARLARAAKRATIKTRLLPAHG